jgi:hypothetical protein
VHYEVVTDKPWSGFNYYEGDYRSRVAINADLPHRLGHLPHLVAHEAYPGHHTEHSLKELTLFQGRGYGEQAIQLINTPECVISEGIAVLAEDFAFPGDEGVRWLTDVLLPQAAIRIDPDVYRRVLEATRALRAVGSNAALLFHRDGRNEREVVQYLAHYGPQTEAEAAKRFSFISNPLWRAYIFTYSVGRQLLEGWFTSLDDAERIARYRKLLTEQITPSQIVRQIAA